MKIATKTSAFFAVTIIGFSAAVRWWNAAPPPLSANQVLALLPQGSSVHSLVRLEMDGRPPSEIAVVARIPSFPGSTEFTAEALLYRYDRLRRHFTTAYRAENPGAVPFSADAARLLAGRDAAVFSGLYDDGALGYRIVGLVRGRAAVLREQRLTGTVHLVEPAVIERRGEAVDALRWNGGSWVPDGTARTIPETPAGMTWRYAVRNGQVLARTNVVHLRRRQPLRVLAAGGGPATVVLPDVRLDVVEAGYRQRVPGTYRIRIVTGFTPPDASYVLTVIVDP
ncbi:MAG: hypothetical protein A2V59_04940 [Armatimonadetes bacterium RBG_19FT_COMBO_69_19]|nr:MAG: hypothetical protein A2V59_04940 [Armatimonadetes bacterium RBG_19FT_COMBO_69_19]